LRRRAIEAGCRFAFRPVRFAAPNRLRDQPEIEVERAPLHHLAVAEAEEPGNRQRADIALIADTKPDRLAGSRIRRRSCCALLERVSNRPVIHDFDGSETV
jgi:hypothetical protein